MKRIYLSLLASLLAAYASYAQNTAWPTTTGNSTVGIGTTTPAPNTKLDIQGGALHIGSSATASADATIHVKTSYGGWDRLSQMSPSVANKPGLNLTGYTNADNSVSWWSWGALTGGTWAIQPNWQFGGNAGLFINRNGYVGIGTSTPLFKQHVKLDNEFSVIQRSATSNYSGHYFITGPDNGFTYNFFVGLREQSDDYHVFNGQTNRDALTVTRINSYLGVGTPTPSELLTIGGESTAGTARRSIRIGAGGFAGPGAINVNSNGDKVILLDFYGYDGRIGVGDHGNLWMKSIANDGYGSFEWFTGSNSTTPQMTLSSAGNISIGTTDAKGYKLAVAGKMIAEEVAVKLQGNWPDYVFRNHYKLRPLTEVKDYIEQNKHLPEMPSEKEVARDGVNLGEIVKLQTKKIEELTLYLIEQQKEINQLKKRVNERTKR